MNEASDAEILSLADAQRAGLVITQVGKKIIGPCSRYCVGFSFLAFAMAQ